MREWAYTFGVGWFTYLEMASSRKAPEALISGLLWPLQVGWMLALWVVDLLWEVQGL